MNIVAKALHQVILCNQRDSPVTKKRYKKSLVTDIKGILAVRLRRRYSQEYNKVLPIVHHAKLLNLLIGFHHCTELGNVKIGRTFHNSSELTLKNIDASKFSFFCVWLFQKVKKYTKYCVVCNLIRPTPAILYEGTRVPGDIGHSVKPYSHISIDNTV